MKNNWRNADGPLTPMMDNVLASRMGSAASMATCGGDEIDHGLSLLAALSRMGFEVRYVEEPTDV